MLHLLEVENFHSIRDRQVIDLRAAANVPDDPFHFGPAWSGSTVKVPKVIAIFGPNAAGKSNVLSALSFAAWFIRASFQYPADATHLPFSFFHDLESLQKPMTLALELSGIDDFQDIDQENAPSCRYRYEVSIAAPSGRHVVENEQLTYWPRRKRGPVSLFVRNSVGKVTAGRDFNMGGLNPVLNRILRPNASVVATLAQLDHDYSKSIVLAASRLISNILYARQESNLEAAAQHYASTPADLESLNREIERLDIGVNAVEVRYDSPGPSFWFHHEGLLEPLPHQRESRGTRNFLEVYPWILRALEVSGIAVIDELDSALHPHLLAEIVRWFHDPVRNPRNAQLWMSCQNPAVLDELVKEEVLFAEKDKQGRTTIFALKNIQGVRRTENFERKYLGGVYGAVPTLG